MSIQFLKDGKAVHPPHSERLEAHCLERGLALTFEWLDGQYWLRSDDPKERPIGVSVDRELKRHEEYFKKSSIHRELLARAIGVKGGVRPRILDLTAGLLGDTLLFLSMGCQVVALERHPAIAFLLRSALENAGHPSLGRLKFQEEDGARYLLQGTDAEVIYFDPMFEDPNQKSLPKKEMRIFRSVIGPDQDAVEVLNLARKLAPQRVVVKRPRLSVPLIETPRPLEYVGKATRYDVYLAQNHGPNESNQIK